MLNLPETQQTTAISARNHPQNVAKQGVGL
jgi:hypothetical protein